jgi:hypothetical protein
LTEVSKFARKEINITANVLNDPIIGFKGNAAHLCERVRRFF